jgi:exodeoxyribonuclease VII small subunit
MVEEMGCKGWTTSAISLRFRPVSKSTSKTDGSRLSKLPFEEALQKLEETVEAMEAGDLPLDTLLTRYEEGMQLAKACQEKLADAEVRIRQLEEAADGALRLKPLTADAAEE